MGLRRLLARLSEGAPRDPGALVEATGVPYRAVAAVLAALDGDVPPELLRRARATAAACPARALLLTP
jgi:hypothetical protein